MKKIFLFLFLFVSIAAYTQTRVVDGGNTIKIYYGLQLEKTMDKDGLSIRNYGENDKWIRFIQTNQIIWEIDFNTVTVPSTANVQALVALISTMLSTGGTLWADTLKFSGDTSYITGSTLYSDDDWNVTGDTIDFNGHVKVDGGKSLIVKNSAINDSIKILVDADSARITSDNPIKINQVIIDTTASLTALNHLKSIAVNAGYGTSGGGAINATRTIAVDTSAITDLNHLKQINITAGVGITGGGNISATRTIAVDTANIVSKIYAGTIAATAANSGKVGGYTSTQILDAIMDTVNANSADLDTVALKVDGNTGLDSADVIGSADNTSLIFGVNAAEKLRIQRDSGYVGINIAAPKTRLHVASTRLTKMRGLTVSQHCNNAAGPYMNFLKSRGTPTSPSTIVSGDTIAEFQGWGYTASGTYIPSSVIRFINTGTVASRRNGSFISFATGTDAAPTIVSEAFRVGSDQIIGIGTGANYLTTSGTKIHGYTVNSACIMYWGGAGADATSCGNISLYHMRGTLASPALVNSGDRLGTINFLGQYSTTVGNVGTGASIRAYAAQAFASNKYGTTLEFFTTANDSAAAAAPRLKITSQGGMAYTPMNTKNTAADSITTSITARFLCYDLRYNNSAAIDLSADPQIVDGLDGQVIKITGLSDVNTLKLDDGAGLQLAGGVSFTLGSGDVIVLTYIASLDLWVETSRSDN